MYGSIQQPTEVLYKKGLLKNFAKFTEIFKNTYFVERFWTTAFVHRESSETFLSARP